MEYLPQRQINVVNLFYTTLICVSVDLFKMKYSMLKFSIPGVAGRKAQNIFVATEGVYVF